jgi:hypothetical protein
MPVGTARAPGGKYVATSFGRPIEMIGPPTPERDRGQHPPEVEGEGAQEPGRRHERGADEERTPQPEPVDGEAEGERHDDVHELPGAEDHTHLGEREAELGPDRRHQGGDGGGDDAEGDIEGRPDGERLPATVAARGGALLRHGHPATIP